MWAPQKEITRSAIKKLTEIDTLGIKTNKTQQKTAHKTAKCHKMPHGGISINQNLTKPNRIEHPRKIIQNYTKSDRIRHFKG